MQTIKDLQQTLFSECKDIIIRISEPSNISEILEKQDLISELLEKISVLRYMENQLQGFQFVQEISDNFQEEEQEQIVIEEETNEAEEIPTTTEIIEEEQEENEENNATEIIFDDIENDVEEEIVEEQNLPLEKEEIQEEEPSVDISFELMEEEEQEILSEVEVIEIEENTEEKEEDIETEEETETLIEEEPKKLKLAKIKVQNSHIDTLFDEETMNEITEKPKEEIKKETTRREFVLDLNDRIAFSKMLFDGSQVELSNVVKRLNAFTDVEDAKQYLSDMYYDKGWDKVDEYAQRLWILVENKFL